MARPKTTKKKVKKNVPVGIAHIHSTFNNTIVTVTDTEGNVLTWGSAGVLGYRGGKKSTPFAAGEVAKSVAESAMAMGMTKVAACIKGPGPGRESAVRSLQVAGLEVTAINDVTPIPHNGCRPPKKPRG